MNKGITLQIVGGPGTDQFIDESVVGGFGKKDKIYDTKEGNVLKLGTEGKDKTSKIAKNNIYEPLGPQFDESLPVIFPSIGYNAGDGVNIGFLFDYSISKFNKAPIGQNHIIGLNFAFATKGIDLSYKGVFYETNNYWDFVINGALKDDRYSFNYFGIGNDTAPPESGGLDDNRVLQSSVYLDFGWQLRFARNAGKFSVRPMIHGSDLTDTEGKFIDRIEENGLTDKDFEKRFFGGFASSLNLANTDNDIHPRDGFRFNNHYSWQKNLNGTVREFHSFGSNFSFYRSFGKHRSLVFATRVGTEFIRGNYDFFFAPTLGQDDNLRGFFGQRYRGATSFYHLTDLRLGLGQFKNSSLPFSMGLTGSFDYGRIFEPGEDSETWHKSAGGGIWFVPLNVLILSATYNRILDDGTGQFKLSIGHAF